LGIRYKRGRLHVHSPDPDYAAKEAAITAVLEQVLAQRQHPNPPAHTGPDTGHSIVLLYLDEAGFLRQPSLAQGYACCGRDQPLARLCHAGQAETRVVAALDPCSGAVQALRQGTISTATLVRFYRQLVAHYPQAKRIYLVVDNWPVHFHPTVLAALEPQETPFALGLPQSWDAAMNLRNDDGDLVSERTLPAADARLAARRRWHDALRHPGTLPVQLLPLPTYAPWLNAIEKLWRLCRQERGHLHQYSEQWSAYRNWLDDFFAGLHTRSAEVLRYCGLLPS
ncbi:MAG: transposase, partial [Caldilineaceae bacterium]